MSKELTTKQETGLSTEVPDFLKDVDPNQGFKGLDADDYVLPRLQIGQKNEKAGLFVNSLTDETYGDEIELIFIEFSKGAVFLTMDDGMKCRSSDGITNDINGGTCKECWLNAYYKDWSKGTPPCTQTYDAYAVKRDSLKGGVPEIFVMSFRRTQFDFAKKKLVSRARGLGKPPYAQSYILGSEEIKHKKGDYFTCTVSYPGWVNKEEYEACEKIYAMISQFRVHAEGSDSSNVSTPKEVTDF